MSTQLLKLFFLCLNTFKWKARGVNRQADRTNMKEDAADNDSLSAFWVNDSNSSRTYACEGYRNPLESKEGALFLSVPSPKTPV